jgi:hypothetical protein
MQGKMQLDIFSQFQVTRIVQIVFLVNNGHSPQIRKNGELLVQMCRMLVSFFKLGHFMYKQDLLGQVSRLRKRE